MARHGFKATLLLIPSLTTLGLLVYCLFSDTWIGINHERLHNITVLYENQYQIATGRMIPPPSSLNRPTVKPISTTSSTTTTTATTTTDSESIYDTDDETHAADETTDGGATQHTAETEEVSEGGSSDEDYETEAVTNEKSRKKRQFRQRDYVYVTKLWPFIKYKGLYSECVQYFRLRMRISKSYLIMENKEPVVGMIDYLDSINNASRASLGCNEKAGQIACLLSRKCVNGRSCDGVVNCDDQTDEQMCDSDRVCSFQTGVTGFKCDSHCWPYYNKCDQQPHCLDMSDELANECAQPLKLTLETFGSVASINNLTARIIQNDHMKFSVGGSDHFDHRQRCFKHFFNFKSARLIPKDSLKYLSQPLADNIQEMNNINYQLQLIYTLAFLFALAFSLMALLSLSFLSCFKKLCFQCPFWFYGFFQILCWLACLVGLMTFFYQYYNGKQRMLDDAVQMPIVSELVRLNKEIMTVEQLGLSFWLAVGATGTSFFASLLSCLICCRLPSSRHEDKEYKIMQLPSYN